MPAPKPNALYLAARFVAELYEATGGRTNRFCGISDAARRAGIFDDAEVELAWRTAEASGFLVKHVDRATVMLTAKGSEAAHSKPGSAH